MVKWTIILWFDNVMGENHRIIDTECMLVNLVAAQIEKKMPLCKYAMLDLFKESMKNMNTQMSACLLMYGFSRKKVYHGTTTSHWIIFVSNFV